MKWACRYKEKQQAVFVANDNVRTFQWKLEIWQTYIYSSELDSFSVPTDSSDEMNGDNKCDFFFTIM